MYEYTELPNLPHNCAGCNALVFGQTYCDRCAGEFEFAVRRANAGVHPGPIHVRDITWLDEAESALGLLLFFAFLFSCCFL